MRRSILVTSTLVLGMTFVLYGQMEKIGPDLQVEMATKAPDELIPIVINLSPQPDLEALRLETEGMGKQERRNYVISQLKNLATNTQTDVLSFLGLQRDHGKAQSIKSIYMANVVAVQLQNQLIPDASNLAGVNYVFLDHVSFDLADTTWNIEKIQANDVWNDFGYKGQGVLVGVMDTGTDYNHTDLHSNVWNNLGEDADGDGHTLEWDGSHWILDPGDLNGIDDDDWDNDPTTYIDDLVGWDWNDGINQDNDPMDDYGHGTHVSGTIAGDGTNGTQTGVSPEAELMLLKIWEVGSGPSSNYWSAVQYALENGADVINLSGGKRYYQVTDAEKATYRQVFEAGVISGITICVAAGNEGDNYGGYDPPNNIRTPGNVPLVITVAATDVNDNRPLWSSRGPVEWWDLCKPADEWGDSICYYDYPYPPGLMKPDVCAPGVNITSTQWGGGYVGGWSGTSMATPATSGTVALILEAAPDVYPKMAKDILEGSALELGPAGKDSLYGSGRIDAYDAIDLIVSVPSAPQNLTLSNEGGNPRLRWNANSEPDLKEYHLYKELSINCFPCQVDTFVYVVTDTTYLDEWFNIGVRPPRDVVTYWVKAVDIADQKSGPSNSRYTKGQSLIQWKQLVEQSLPEVYSLSHNYPNPFNPVTTIKYDLPEESFVELRIFNLLGEEIRTLVSGSESAGSKSTLWDGKDNSVNLVSSGMYIYKFSAKSLESDREFHQIKKMVLIR